MNNTIDISNTELVALRSLRDWVIRAAPNGIPMEPVTREGLILLGQTKEFFERLPEPVAEEEAELAVPVQKTGATKRSRGEAP